MSNASCIEARPRWRRWAPGTLPLLGIVLVLSAAGAIILGRYPLSLRDILAFFGARLHLVSLDAERDDLMRSPSSKSAPPGSSQPPASARRSASRARPFSPFSAIRWPRPACWARSAAPVRRGARPVVGVVMGRGAGAVLHRGAGGGGVRRGRRQRLWRGLHDHSRARRHDFRRLFHRLALGAEIYGRPL